MASLNGEQLKDLLAKGHIGQVADDEPVAIRLKYVGTGTVTSVTVTTATNIVMVTSDGGTDTYAFATYDTVAKLVAAINADGIFEAKVLDTLLSKATASAFVDGAITISSDGYYNVLSDTSSVDYLAYRLTYDREVGSTKPIAGHRVELQEIVYNVTLGGTGTVKIYETDGSVETQIYNIAAVSGAATTLNWASGQAKITAENGNDLLIIVEDNTSITGSLTVAGRLV